MVAPANSNLMGAAILRKAGQKAPQTSVNYAGTAQPAQKPQMAAGAGITRPGPAQGTNVARPAPAPMAQPAQRTAVPFYAGAQQRASMAQGGGGPVPARSTAAAPPMRQGGMQVRGALPSRAGPASAVNVQRAGAPQVLGAAVPTQAYDPGAGRERADQSLMGPKTLTRAQIDDAAGLLTSGPLGQNTGNATPTLSPAQLANIASSTGDNPYGDIIANVGGALFDPAAKLSGEMANSVNAQAENFDEAYLGNYDEASGKIRDAGAGLLDPNAQAAAEAAARDSLYTGIGRERDAAVAQMLDRANRGGRTGSGSTNAAYQSAIAAAQEGERGLAQDAFGRRLQATGAGANLLGQGAGMDYQKIRDLYADPQKMLELIMAMGPDFVDALVPL